MLVRPVLIALFSVVASCATGPKNTGASAAQDQRVSSVSGDLAEFIREYEVDRAGISRFYDLPWSEHRFDRLEQHYTSWRQRLAAQPFDSLDQQGRIDFILLRNKLTLDLNRLNLDRRRLAEMNDLLPFRAAIQELQRSAWRMEPANPREAASTVAAFPEQIKKLRPRIEKGRKAKEDAEKAESGEPSDAIKVSPVLAQRAAAAVGDLRATLADWYRYHDGYQPEFSWWLRKPHEEAAKALDDYAKFLRETVAGIKGEDDDPLIGDPIGAEALAADLAYEMIPYSPQQLIAIGEREFAWCEAEMTKAAKDMGFDDWKQALAKVKADHVPPGEQDQLVAEQARFAIQFLKDRDLITIPPLCEETWRLTMISPQRQRTLPFAAYGGQNMMVAYPTDSMKHDDKLMSMRGNNRHFTRIVTPHELIPGHHLQGFMAERIRPYRRMFTTPFFVEGWCLYWEMTLWDLNYPRTPEERIGMLFWRMHRCARIIVSLKFHLNQMKPAEMVDFLVDRVGHERFGATSEVRRFIGGDYSPLYQAGYMLGGLQVRAMRKELVDSGKMSERDFHDTLLTYGSIPVELIRAGMMNLPLASDSVSSWKFAGDVAAD
ncbi:MAG: DUF885 family protein [Phycisphaeraceae bacterium]|nr:DUF885 family protein [Phycisphaeraceae bacterium]